jgi:hypothetical protein
MSSIENNVLRCQLLVPMSICYVYGPCDGDGFEIGKRLVSFASGTKNKRQPLERKLNQKRYEKT